jgi:hypothetical protein
LEELRVVGDELDAFVDVDVANAVCVAVEEGCMKFRENFRCQSRVLTTEVGVGDAIAVATRSEEPSQKHDSQLTGARRALRIVWIHGGAVRATLARRRATVPSPSALSIHRLRTRGNLHQISFNTWLMVEETTYPE